MSNQEKEDNDFKYNYNKANSGHNNNKIVLKKSNKFIINNYMFLIGIINKDNLYFESKIKGTYYNKILTKENIYLLNEIFIKYKNIKDIYELIILSLNDSKIKIELMKNNKLKLTFSIKNEENSPSPFEIILKSEEENNDQKENDSMDNESKKHKSHNK